MKLERLNEALRVVDEFGMDGTDVSILFAIAEKRRDEGGNYHAVLFWNAVCVFWHHSRACQTHGEKRRVEETSSRGQSKIQSVD